MKEEIDQDVIIETLFATYEDESSYQHFYQIELQDYDNVHLGTGDGTEFVDPTRGSYEIVWINLSELKDYKFYPLEIRDKIIEKFYLKKKNKGYYKIKV